MRIVIVFVALAIIAMGATVGIQAQLQDTAEQTIVDNETWTPTAGSVTQLDDSELDGADYSDTADVYDSNGALMTDGTDYEWFEKNGTVKALSGGALDGETEATITYDYDRPPEDQLEMASTLSHIPQVGGFLLLLVPVLFLIKLVGGG